MKYPAEFDSIPKKKQAKATVVFSGIFLQGRTPCFWVGEQRRWYLTTSFRVEFVYKGKIPTGQICNVNLIGTKHERLSGGEYLVLLNPNAESERLLLSGKNWRWNLRVEPQEIIEIVPITKNM